MIRILIPTDFSLLARKAAEYALLLSRHIDAEYIILHCDNVPRPSYSFVNKLDDILREEAFKTGRDLIESLRESTGIQAKVTFDFTFGDPVEVLEDYAKQHEVDLIVMGTKGETVIKNRIFGSVAAGVLEHVSIPTLFIPSNASSTDIRTIAFATDLTNLKEELEELIVFARFFDAAIQVVHIYPDLIDPDAFNEERSVMDLIKKTQYPKVTFHPVMDTDIIEGLDKFIEAERPDLLAMFTYKSGVLEYLFNTSYTEKMTMHSKTPLLILRKK